MPRIAHRSAGASLAGAVLFALFVVPACDDGAGRSPFEALERDPSFPGTAGDEAAWARLFEFQPLPGCAVANPAALGVVTPLRIFRGPGVSDADVGAFLGGLQRYYSQYGVRFTTAFDVITVPLHEALILDRDVLAARVRNETGVDIDADDSASLPPAEQDRVVHALGGAIMHNVRELLRVYATPRRAELNVVLLPEMVTGTPAPELQTFAGLLGLGLSPEMFAEASTDDPARMLYEWLDLPDGFTPTAILGVRPVNEFLLEPDIAIAHEVGHAYGLPHVAEAGNLLHPGEITCQQSLSTAQLEHILARNHSVSASRRWSRRSFASRSPAPRAIAFSSAGRASTP